MSIYLVQHAKALSRDLDPEKGISEDGRSDTLRIAEVAKGYQVPVDKIAHSGKKRAGQTAEILAELLNPESNVEIYSDLNPLDDVKKVAERLSPSSNLMLVGHLPHFEKLTSWLVSGQTDHPVFRFQNSGIVCIDKMEDEDLWYIKWTLMPNIG